MDRILFHHFLHTAFDREDYSTDEVIAFVFPLFRRVLAIHEEGLVAPFGRASELYVEDGAAGIGEGVTARKGMEATDEPLYLPAYGCFEQVSGHHDPQTDIFCLGLVLGSMAMGLDLHDEEDLRKFVGMRTRVSSQYPRIHPTVGWLITEMTEADRTKRSQDLSGVRS